MFRLHGKLKSEKSGEKLSFKFSNFQLLQVPKGWDRLYVSLISVETGKALTKSGKASVRNGNCQWTEALSESIWMSQRDASKEIEECLFKLVVSMGSTKSSILGEATVNLASYRSSKTAIPVSLPLKKCNHGTILQVKIQCLTPRPKFREEQWEDTGSYMEDENVDYDDVESKSDVSDSSLTKSVGSSSSNHLDSSSSGGELHSKDFSFSASGSRYSFESMEGSLGRDSPRNNSTSIANNHIGRQDSTDSQNSYPYGSYSFNDSSKSNLSSFNSKVSTSRSSLQNQRDESNRVYRSVASSPLRNAGSSKDLLEAAEVTIEELRAEARMWEQNARKLMIDMEKLRRDLSDQLNRQESLEIEVTESRTECDGLKQQIEEMKFLLEESIGKQKSAETLNYQAKEMDDLQKQLEDEVKFQKESNADLALQLKKTQESNIELVSILQELEDTIEKQKKEIANLSKMQSEDKNLGKYGLGFEENGEIKPNEEVPVKDISKVSCDSYLEVEHELVNLPSGLEPDGERDLELEIQKLRESAKNLESTIQFLEKSLEEKTCELEDERSLKTQTLMDFEAQWRDKLSVKEEKIINLEARLSEALKADGLENADNNNLMKEVEVLKQRIEELEKDCNELTDENIELLLKLKESKGDLPGCGASSNSLSNGFLENDSLSTSESTVSKMKSQICKLEEELNEKEMLIERLSTDKLQNQFIGLEKKCSDLEVQLQAYKDKTCYLNDELCKCQARAEEQEIEIAALQQQLVSYQEKETQKNGQFADMRAEFKSSQSDDAVEISKTLSELHEQIQLCLSNAKKQHFVQLKDLFEAKVGTLEVELKRNGKVSAREANGGEVQKKLETCNLEENALRTSNLGQDLQMKFKPEITDSGKEILEKISEIEKLKSDNLLTEEQVKSLRNCQRELETQISNLKNERTQLEEDVEVMIREGAKTSACLDDSCNETMVINSSIMTSTGLDELQNETRFLNSTINSHLPTENTLPSKLLELESSKCEVEAHLSELEKENVWLSERISGLEAQLRYLTDERETSRLELHNSESSAINLQEEINRLKSELEAQKSDGKQKLQGMQKQWLETQSECEYLKIANVKLQMTAESLIDECSLLQQSIIELRKQKLELHGHCAILEAELRESRNGFSDVLKEIESLEGKYALMLEEITTKEKALGLELDALLQENKTYREKLVTEESLLNQMYLEKEVEAENLHREIARLTEYISATPEEKERTGSAAMIEVSQLRADKAMLKASLQEIQQKLKLSESNLSTLQMESETKLLGLMDELSASKQNLDVLMADHEKLLELLEDVKSNEEKHKNIVRGLDLKLKASAYVRLQLEEEISSLRVQLQKTAVFQDEILSLKRSLDEVQFENQRLEVSHQILSGDQEELKAEKMVLLQMISDMQRAVYELESCKRSKVSLEEKVLRLQGDLTAREALGAEDAELKNELSRVKRANSELQRKIRELQEEKQEYLRRTQAFEAELKKKRKAAKQDSPNSSDTSLDVYSEDNAISSNTSSQVDIETKFVPGSSTVMGIDPSLKIEQLENELAETLEANDMYKTQLKSLLNEGKLSSMEIELRELRDSYFHMSLKCAEVESEREQLVLKLRAVSNGRS
ncbi:CAP-Gly domain-containing linker protein 1 isoform X2 [Jatropha curcas]|uniref:CAP-Gly domain-containing linker protein 1 isoform X2 n=1 Tax=Jatropha curcas TaxID=180498 RepID=UPI0009D6C969|nr:CAP-Gly domain-containing linker protein 1 isoform X2 [Jatropha curcas]